MQWLRDMWTREGPGIPKDAPKRTGLALFAEILVREWWEMVKLNILFILAGLFVVTLPAALAAMARVSVAVVEDRNTYLLRDFTEAFLRYFWRATAWGLALGGALADRPLCDRHLCRRRARQSVAQRTADDRPRRHRLRRGSRLPSLRSDGDARSAGSEVAAPRRARLRHPSAPGARRTRLYRQPLAGACPLLSGFGVHAGNLQFFTRNVRRRIRRPSGGGDGSRPAKRNTAAPRTA